MTTRPSKTRRYFLFGLLLIICGCKTRQTPHSYSSNEVPKAIQGISPLGHFSLTCLCFFDNNLYVATNIGLLKFKKDSLSEFLQWDKSKGNVISEPCNDPVNNKLWILHEWSGALSSFNGQVWGTPKTPQTEKEITRGDVLNGGRLYSSSSGFFIEAIRAYWKWNEQQNTWTQQPIPHFKKAMSITYDGKTYTSEIDTATLTRIIPIGKTVFCVMRFDQFSFLDFGNHESDKIFYLDSTWKQIPNIPNYAYFVETVVTLKDKEAYMLTQDKKILHLLPLKMDTINSIGQCDAIASSSSGFLAEEIRFLYVSKDMAPS